MRSATSRTTWNGGTEMGDIIQTIVENGQLKLSVSDEIPSSETKEKILRQVKKTVAKILAEYAEYDEVWEVKDKITDPLAYPTIGVKINILVPGVNIDEP